MSNNNNKQLAVKKGFTITCHSWENDGDYNNTKSITVQSELEAKMYYDALQICKSRSRDNTCIGNSIDTLSIKQLTNIVEFFKKYETLLCTNYDERYSESANLNLELIDDEDEIRENVTYAFSELVDVLLGCSEFYLFRVCESVTVTYSENDIYVDLVDMTDYEPTKND